MASQVFFKDFSAGIKTQMKENVKRALTAMGDEAVTMIQENMETGYGKPIWQTGNLSGDVHKQLNDDGASVDVGNSLEYAPYVHEGTYKMKSRPYIRDALTDGKNQERLKEIAEAYLKEGFNG